MKSKSPKSSVLRVAHALLFLSLPPVVSAADVTWTGASDNAWINTGNWSSTPGGVIAGGTTGTTNADVAFFKTDPANKALTIDSANLNIRGITFDTSVVGAFTIGNAAGNTLLLSSGGTIQMNSTVATSQVINAPLSIQNAAASSSGVYTIQNNAASSANTLTLGGAITGAATSGSTILTYAGSNTGANTISGAISNGSGGGVLALTKNGSGTLTLSGSNSYTGATVINNGVLAVTNSYALGASALTMANNNLVALQLSGNVTLNNSIAVGNVGPSSNGVLQSVSGSNTLTNFKLAGSAARLSVSTGSILDITNNMSGGTLGMRILGGGTLQLDGDNSAGLGGFILGGAGGLTVKVGNNRSLGNGLVTFDANSTLQSKDATAYTLGNTLSFTANTSAVTFGSASTGNLIFTGSTALSTNLGLNIANAQTTMSGILGGSGSLAKGGTGMLLLSASNGYTGATTVSQGTLTIQNDNALGNTAGDTTVSSGATLGIQGGITVGAETLSLSGSGVSNGGALRNISGNNTYGGSIALADNTRIASDAGTLTVSGGVTGSGYGLTIGGAGNTTINSSIATGAGSLTMDGGGTVTLSGSNSYSGPTYIGAGVLVVAHSNALGTSAVTTGSGSATTALQLSGDVTVTNSIALAGVGPGSKGVLQNVSGSNTLTNFQFGLGTSARLSVANGSTLSITNGITATSGTALGIRILGGGTLQLDGDNSAGLGGLVLGDAGVGGLVVKVSKGSALGSGNVTFDANATIQSKDATAYTLGNTLTFSANTSAVTLGAASTGNLTFNGSATLATNLGLTVANAQTTMNGIISGTGSLNKLGNGTLTLSGSNTYSGSTTVSAGKLAINGSTSTSSSVTIATSGTLGGSGTVGGSVTVQSGGRLAPGNSISSTFGTGALTLAAGSISDFELGTASANRTAADTSTTNDRTTVNGALALDGTLNLIDNANAGGLGSAGAGSYRIFAQSGLASGNFSAVNNISGYHARVDSSTAGSVYVDNYQIAAANTLPATVNLGITHVGAGFTSSALSIENTSASNGYAEGLNATKGATLGAATLGGADINNLAGGATSTSITVGLNDTSTAGLVSGTVGIGFASNGSNSGYLDTDLATQLIQVQGQVNEYALPTLTFDSGVGTLTGSGTSYTLNLGSFDLNSLSHTATLTLSNILVALDANFQDDLGGTFDVSGLGISLLGLDSGVLAGSSENLTVTFDTTGLAANTYTGLIQFNSTSVNLSGTTARDTIQVALEYQVVPEPTTWTMIVGGMGMMAFAQRIRRRIGA